jgi:hypothetical protein
MNDDFYEFEYFFGNINRNLGPEFMINYIMKSDSEKYDIIQNFPVYLFDSEDDYAQILNNLRIINS